MNAKRVFPSHTTSFWNIIIQRTSHGDLTETIFSLVFSAKLVKWQKCKTAFCDLTEKLLVSNFIGQPNLQSILEAKSMHESSLKKIYYISFYSIFFRSSYFYCEWPQLATILTSLDLSFVTKSESLIFELKQAIHSGKDLNCKN